MTLAASAAAAKAYPEPPIDKLDPGTKNPKLSGDVCKAGNFNFVVDMSGSIGPQYDGDPGNLKQLKDGITGFVDAFSAVPDTNGKYAGVKFSGSSASIFTTTAGYVAQAPFKTAVGALSGPDGLTPTAKGIDTGASNDANPISGAPKVMFVLTDGSPNNPPGTDLDQAAPWLTAANAAIASANAARADGYVVEAVYLSTANDPGDTTLPFDPAGGKAAWAKAVMTAIGGGSYFDADFTSFIDDLFNAIHCPLPNTKIVTNASDSAELGNPIHDVATLSGGKEPTGKITFKLYGPDDADCNGEVAFTNDVTVNQGNHAYSSDNFTPTKAGTYDWIAKYSGDDNNAPSAGECGDDHESVTITEKKVPNINVVKGVAAFDEAFGPTSQAQPGDDVYYQITVKNTGNATATGVRVTDDITAILAHSDYNGDCAPTVCSLATGDVLTWAPVDLAAGATKTFTFSVELDDQFPDGTTHLPNLVVVTGPGSNCPAIEHSTVTEGSKDCQTDTTVNAYLLTIKKSNDAPLATLELPNHTIVQVPSANVGDTVTYTLKYHVGDLAVTNGVITDVVPAGVEYVVGSASGDDQFDFVDFASGKLTWKADGVSKDGTLTYKGKIAPGANGMEQPLTNVVTIDSAQTEPDDASSDVYVPAEVAAETSNPTPPQTDAFADNTTSGPGVSLPLILAVLGALILGLAFITPMPAVVRRRNGR